MLGRAEAELSGLRCGRGRDQMVTVTAPSAAFVPTDKPLPHRARAKQILAAHPDVRALFGRNGWSALWTVLLVALQVAMGIGLASVGAPWWATVIAAYAV